jgi:hypothetical protein
MKFIRYIKLKIFLLPALFISIHFLLLFVTQFRDWSDMIMHPWLLSQGLILYETNIFNYTPGEPFILKALYELFGYSLTSLRLIAYLFIFINDVILYFISIKIFKSQKIALVVLGFYIFWHIPFEGNSIWFESIYLPFILVSFYQFWKFIEKPNNNRLILSGLFIGIAYLIKQTNIWPILGTVLILIIYNLRNRKKIFVHIYYYLFPIIILNIITVLYFALKGTAFNYLFWSILFSIGYSRLTPYYFLYPSLSQILYILPAYAGPILTSIILVTKRKHQGIIFFSALYLVVFNLSLLLTSLPRFGILKLLAALPFAAIALGYFCSIKNIFINRISYKYLFFGILTILLLGTFKTNFKFYLKDNIHPISFFNPSFLSMVENVKATIGDQEFFVFGNYDYLYYVLGKKPTVLPFVFQAPWIIEVPGVQDQLVSSLITKQTPYVLYFPFHQGKLYYDDYVPKKLYDYIMTTYHPTKQLQGYGWILVRN